MSTLKKSQNKTCNTHQFCLRPKSNICFYQQQITLHLCCHSKQKLKLDK